MMGSAQLDRLPEEKLEDVVVGMRPDLRQEAAERLAAHRMRRARQAASAGVGAVASAPRGGKRGQVAAAVAERFAHTPSYRAALADEARLAMERAAAEAEVALRNAEAVVAAQSELLAELGKWTEPVKFSPETAVVAVAEAPVAVPKPVAAPVAEISTAGLTVRLYEDVGRTTAAGRRNKTDDDAAPDADEAMALEEEIAFRQAPVFEVYEPHEPAVPIPANLLEFPRQLKAAKKERPRLAEGPLLLEEASRSPQLRIFEVGPVIAEPEPEPLSTVLQSIWLDAHTVTEVVEDPYAAPTAMLASLLPPQVAPMQIRLMAAAVDAALVLGGFVAFCAAVAKVAGTLPGGPQGGIAGLIALVTLYFAYQALFFTLSDQTPGMRYARIGLCTFSDENPSRSAMRKRILAQVVAVCPLGLGVLWMLLDDDRLGWTDRISRMYQRAY